jgi:EAL domain-containing protein (putative c-di-GMP-specific phosphodiesterase class I)
MYRAKNRGRNAYEFFRHEAGDWPIERLRLEADIRYAIARDELRLVFQPQFSLADDTLVGAEALLRWQHPERGMISPADFIPIAEETGLIVPIGEWVLREACRHWAGWLAQGLSPGLLAVNVSGIELQRGHIQTSVEDSLSVTRLPPEALELEVTESTIMNFAEAGVRALDALRNLGVRIAIDDFGTGYSSLSYLKRLPVTKLKIDRSFVDGLPDGAEDAAIAGAVLALAKSLKLSTIAEGVETEAQRQFLRDAGCEQAQGFLLGRPMPPGEFEALLRRRSPSAAQPHHAQ